MGEAWGKDEIGFWIEDNNETDWVLGEGKWKKKIR
jgi:hypothetical protein